VCADQLSWGQASLLAGLVNAPTAYDPTAHLTLARSRQRHVLNRLVATHVFTPAEADAVFAEPLKPALPFAG
jgi:membrane peptidoglycan carboxypeptidase